MDGDQKGEVAAVAFPPRMKFDAAEGEAVEAVVTEEIATEVTEVAEAEEGAEEI